MTPRQRIEGVLGVLGFVYVKGDHREPDWWTHPHCAPIDDAALGESLQTESQLVRHIFNSGRNAARKDMQIAAKALFGF